MQSCLCKPWRIRCSSLHASYCQVCVSGVCVRVCVCLRVRACVCVCVRACVRIYSMMWDSSNLTCSSTSNPDAHSARFVFSWTCLLHAFDSPLSDMTFSYLRRLLYLIWLLRILHDDGIHIILWLLHIWQLTFFCSAQLVTRPIYMCAMTRSYVWHDSMALLTSDVTPAYLTNGVRLFRPTYDVTHLFICAPWLVHICDMTQSYV